jgi:hypothetical protein
VLRLAGLLPAVDSHALLCRHASRITKLRPPQLGVRNRQPVNDYDVGVGVAAAIQVASAHLRWPWTKLKSHFFQALMAVSGLQALEHAVFISMKKTSFDTCALSEFAESSQSDTAAFQQAFRDLKNPRSSICARWVKGQRKKLRVNALQKKEVVWHRRRLGHTHRGGGC